MIDGKYLGRHSVIDVCHKVGWECMSQIYRGNLEGAITYARNNDLAPVGKGLAPLETAVIPLMDENGKHIIIKIKRADHL
ncbi:MAG: hypothetical protein LBR42_02280 [Candidatus Methanoplasma sp.]|nr:hypothetical protein [Candidatus Methanoplasma sp.]